jgi:hypothetical protein
MYYRRTGILFIIILVVGLLISTPGSVKTILTPVHVGLPDSDSPSFSGVTEILYPGGSRMNLPPVPRFYRETLPAGIDRQWIDLSWNAVNNPHTVVIYTPDSTLGPFENADNGVVDRRIFLEISSGSNLTPGPWYYQVRSAGTSPFGNDTFRIYRDSGDAGA